MKAYKRFGKTGSVSLSEVGVPLFGSDETDVVFTLYANPMSETCRELLGERWDVIERDFLSGDEAVGFRIVMVAPEMQSWASKWSFDTVRGVKSVVGRGEVSATDISEASVALYDLEGKDVFIKFVRRVFSVPVSELTFDRLQRIVDDMGGDGERVIEAIENRSYQRVVRDGTEQWLWMVPDDYIEGFGEAVVFINGHVIPDCNMDALRQNVLAGRRLMGEELVLDEDIREKLIGSTDLTVDDFR